MSTDTEITVAQIVPWAYGDGTLRQVLDQNGRPWFSLIDICRCIGVRNPHQAAARLDDDEITDMKLAGSSTTVRVVNEPGAYHLLLTSRTPQSAELRRWLTHVVLPRINKTGAYLTQKLSDEIASLLDYQDRCTDQALYEMSNGQLDSAALHLFQARISQDTLNKLIDRQPLPITRGCADQIRNPAVRKALGMSATRQPEIGPADDASLPPASTYRYPAQYAR